MILLLVNDANAKKWVLKWKSMREKVWNQGEDD